MMIGIALWTDRISAATIVTTTDVLVLLDCSSTVPKTPKATPATGLSTEPISCAAPLPLRPLNAFPMSDKPTKNSQSKNRMISVLTKYRTGHGNWARNPSSKRSIHGFGFEDGETGLGVWASTISVLRGGYRLV